jgi:hypothetical protein
MDGLFREPPSFQMREPSPEPASIKGQEQHYYWMAHAALAATKSTDRSFRSGACAVREDRLLVSASNGFPAQVHISGARRKDSLTRHVLQLSAPSLLVSQAAAHGVSLRGSDVYIWPMLEEAPSAALLANARVGRVFLPGDVPIPSRLEDEMRLTRIVLAEVGIRLEVIDMADAPPILRALTGDDEQGVAQS